MDLHVGTSGYSYKEWKGPFYPEKLPAREMLAYYAARLDSVEVNNTFYRMPKREVLAGWAEQVPETFRFAVKASRRITHHKRLKDTSDELEFLLGNLAALGERLGCVLFQLPPNLKLDLERLDRFIDALPETARCAFEFRHPSWRDTAVDERLRARNFARVAVDAEEEPAVTFEPTADWSYLRLRRSGYEAGELRDWVKRIRRSEVAETFVFFKHEDAGAGPKFAARFVELAAAARPRSVASRRKRAAQ